MKLIRNKGLVKYLVAGIVFVGLGLLVWMELRPVGLGDGFASGNGRIEATEIDVASKLAGRILTISVDEGDFVKPEQVIATMDTQVLQAQIKQAEAQVRQAENAVDRPADRTKAPVLHWLAAAR